MSLLSLFYPTFFILKILLSSTLTAFYLCKMNNKPFFNPQLYSYIYLADKLRTIIRVGKQVILNYNIIYFGLSQYYLHEESLDFEDRIFQNIKFVFLLEFIAYVYHRLSHEIPYIYKNSHEQHHRNIDAYPIDFLEFDIVDNIAQTVYINAPLYFVPMHIYDYAWIYYIYATGAFLIHSDMITNDHIIHHRRFKYNYCLLIPIFDGLFGTYLGENTEKQEKKDGFKKP